MLPVSEAISSALVLSRRHRRNEPVGYLLIIRRGGRFRLRKDCGSLGCHRLGKIGNAIVVPTDKKSRRPIQSIEAAAQNIQKR
jgi:hypothetical protein